MQFYANDGNLIINLFSSIYCQNDFFLMFVKSVIRLANEEKISILSLYAITIRDNKFGILKLVSE